MKCQINDLVKRGVVKSISVEKLKQEKAELLEALSAAKDSLWDCGCAWAARDAEEAIAKFRSTK